MADFNSKYTGEEVEQLLDQVANGEVGGGETLTEADIAAMGFTKNQGTITEVKMNGVSKGTSGVVDLGDVPSKNVVDTLVDWHEGADADIAALYEDKQDNIADLDAIRDGAAKGATAVQPSSLANVATSGSYNDLSDKPTIPSEVTESTVSGWGFTKNAGTYSKPSGGIPRSDLDNEVITALRKAEQYTGILTDVKMNGSALGVNAGVVDIGNVVTGVKVNNATKSPSGGVVDLGSVGTYSKPSGGIPKTDLASDVQTLLAKANVAVTKDNIGELETIQTQGFNGSLNDMLYALPDEANGNEDDILLSRDTVKTINGQSIFGSGNITIEGGGGKMVVQVRANSGFAAIDPDKIYVMVDSIGSFPNLTLNQSSSAYDEYVVHFRTGESVTSGQISLQASTLKWANGEVPTLEPNSTYELSVVGCKALVSTIETRIHKAVLTRFA